MEPKLSLREMVLKEEEEARRTQASQAEEREAKWREVQLQRLEAALAKHGLVAERIVWHTLGNRTARPEAEIEGIRFWFDHERANLSAWAPCDVCENSLGGTTIFIRQGLAEFFRRIDEAKLAHNCYGRERAERERAAARVMEEIRGAIQQRSPSEVQNLERIRAMALKHFPRDDTTREAELRRALGRVLSDYLDLCPHKDPESKHYDNAGDPVVDDAIRLIGKSVKPTATPAAPPPKVEAKARSFRSIRTDDDSGE